MVEGMQTRILRQFVCPLALIVFAIPSIARAEEAFKKANNTERLQVLIEDVPHTVTNKAHQATVAFCAKWLKK